MNSTTNDPVDWLALGAWFGEAEGIMEDLTTCSLVVQAMVGGEPAWNLAAAEDLERLTCLTGVWLTTHPCPESWVHDFLVAIIHVLIDLRESTRRSEGDAVHADDRFAAKVVRADLMISELRSIAGRLHMYVGFDAHHA